MSPTARRPFVALALVAGAVASIIGADGAAVAVWSVASGVVGVELVVVTLFADEVSAEPIVPGRPE